MIIEHMTDLIGDTPLLKIPSSVTGFKNIELYAKLEMMNPFGSVKDRTAWAMIKDDLEDIKAFNKTIYENSSGNTAKSLQAIASVHGINFRLVSALTKVEEQKDVLKIMGSEIEEIATASDCFDPSDPNDPQYMIERKMAANPDQIYFPSQFTNSKNPEYHEQTTAKEITEDLGMVDYFFGGLGTTGSSLGISMHLKKLNPSFQSVGVTAQTSHFIPGIRNMSQMMESEMFQKDYYDHIQPLTEKDALDGMMKLIRECAVLCGPSSGANFTAALSYLKEQDEQATTKKKAVFVVCDRMEWYISYIKERKPELFGEKPIENGLLGFDDSLINIVPEVQPDNLELFMASHPDMLMIDIRNPQSFELVSIPTSINMPNDMFRKWIDGKNPFQTNRPVLLICAVGEQSRYYAAYLRTLGCQAYNLTGGIMTWHDTAQAA